jgi:2-polyprenyl-3-methyl-5-hydroxy-6-metoxy-1,4-benzoquinol methylase
VHPIATYEEIPHLHKERYHIASLYCEGRSTIDIACGVGYGAHILAQKALSVHGMDSDVAAIDFAVTHWSGPNIQYSFGDILNLPEMTQCDCVVSLETIEHLPVPFSQAVAIYHRLLRPGGALVLSYPDNEPNPPNACGGENHFHTHIKNKDVVMAVHEGGFQVGNVIFQGSVPLMGIGYSHTIVVGHKR